MDIPGQNGSSANDATSDTRQIGHVPPFFTNPFMAPFLPQHGPNLSDPNSDRSSLSPHSSSSNPSPNDPYLLQQKPTDFRLNPLTGGYYLSPSQYQQMMNQYMQNLIIAAQASGNNPTNDLKNMIDPTLSGFLNDPASLTHPMSPNFPLPTGDFQMPEMFSQPIPTSVKNPTTNIPLQNNEFNNFAPNFTSLSSTKSDVNSLFPMTSANLDNNHEETAENRVSSSPPVSDSPSLIDPNSKSKGNSPDNIDQPNQASSSSSPAPNDQINEDAPSKDHKEETPTPNKSRSNSTDLQEVSKTVPEEPQKEVKVDNEKPSTSPKSEDLKRPMDPNFVPTNQQPKITANTSSTEERTSELIKKQMNEIEKEISRRMQNQNIRKIDEKELAQLLNDHGFGNFVDANQTTSADFAVDFTNSSGHGIPYRPPQSDPHLSQAEKPTLEQLRSSFSPPDDQPIPSNSMADSIPYNFGMTATGSGLGLHGPAAFATSPILPQTISPANYQSQSPMANGHYTTIPNQQQQPFQFINPNAHNPNQSMMFNGSGGMNSPFNYMNYVQGQPPLNQMPQHASPYAQQFSTPTITPEMAAALLQQLQQQNPSLLQNLVGQHNFANNNQPVPNTNQNSTRVNAQQFENVENAVKCTAVPQSPKQQISGIPAPPLPKNSINRKTSEGISNPTTQQYSNENGWPTTSNQMQNVDQEPACENKENGQDPPVWVMRDTFLKRMQREEQKNRQNGCSESEQPEVDPDPQQQNAEIEEEETDKLLKKDHNEVAEEAIRGQRKGSNKKETIVHEPAVLIEGVLFRARYLGSTQLVSDGRATKSSRMHQAQEAVSRVKAPDGETQPSTEIDLFISTEKIMVLNTDLQRISETDVRQDIVIDLILKSVSYIADIGDLVVLIARRIPQSHENGEEDIESIKKTPRMICHVFESEEASFIVQSIGQAFQVAYVEFLRANGIDDPAYLREIDYQEVLNSQELMGEELEMFAKKETQKDVIVPKKVGEALGVVVVESGWGSMLPTVVLANLAPGGPAARSNQLNIGDQIIAINGISLVGLPLIAAQQNIKNAKTSTAVRLTVVSTPPVVEVRIKRPDTKYQLGFSVQNGVICSLLRGGIAERGGIRVGHRIIEINSQSVVAVQHEKIVNMLATATGEIHMKTMPTSMFRLLTGQEVPNYI